MISLNTKQKIFECILKKFRNYSKKKKIVNRNAKKYCKYKKIMLQ